MEITEGVKRAENPISFLISKRKTELLEMLRRKTNIFTPKKSFAILKQA
jgi:hypothetical protein